jgi:hypothetical protein
LVNGCTLPVKSLQTDLLRFLFLDQIDLRRGDGEINFPEYIHAVTLNDERANSSGVLYDSRTSVVLGGSMNVSAGSTARCGSNVMAF